MLNVSLVGDREMIARLEAMPDKLHAALLRKVTALTLKLEAKIKEQLSGKVLKVRTGKLRRSIHSRVDSTPVSVTGMAASSGDVKYAGIHEFGGQTKAHIIEARNAKALAFKMNGKQVFFARVNHPGSKMPERSFMRSSLKEMRDEIVQEMNNAAAEAARE
jgi:HK97 gp10 family phage protein